MSIGKTPVAVGSRCIPCAKNVQGLTEFTESTNGQDRGDGCEMEISWIDGFEESDSRPDPGPCVGLGH